MDHFSILRTISIQNLNNMFDSVKMNVSDTIMIIYTKTSNIVVIHIHTYEYSLLTSAMHCFIRYNFIDNE